MIKIIKLIRSLLEKGFATADEKSSVESLYKDLDTEEKGVVQSDFEKIASLPANDPKTDEGELEKNLKIIIDSAVKSATKKETEGAVDAIKSEVKAWLETQKEAIEQKAGMYNKSVVEKRHGLSVYMRKFFSALLTNDQVEMCKLNGVATTKELTSDSTGAPFGGYVVLSDLSMEVRSLIGEYGVARQEFTNVQLSKHKYEALELATDITVQWTGEGQVIPSSQVVFAKQDLELKKLTAIVSATRELLEDSEIDLFAFIGTRVAEAFARKEDEAFFMGEGASDTANGGFLGLVNNPDLNQASMAGDTFAEVTAEDLLAMQDASPQSISKNGKYYMHRSIRNLIRGLKSTPTGQFIFQAPTDNAPSTIWGRPVVEVEVMPSVADTDTGVPFILYGDLKKSSILGYKGAMSVDRFNAGSVRNVANNADINLITTDREAVRWIERVGAVTVLPSAVTALSTAVS